eukprot:TRINITY_DN45911_c0_g1_i1.p1 TRINITY_DN45911_c0_g1~~TRINITY_DN45911_c0_g1_i1.p1  ORF type:complete len:164 (+),score=39.68 TRINITY_DN45911_c0_g1_i1:32-493(+)
MSAEYWEAGAIARLNSLMEEAEKEASQLALANDQFRSQMTFELSMFRQKILRVMKENRDYEDRCLKLELKLDSASEHLGRLSESASADVRDKGISYKDRRKVLLRHCEGLVESNKEFKQHFDSVVGLDGFDALFAKYPPPQGIDLDVSKLTIG